MSQSQILIHQMSFHHTTGIKLFDNLSLVFSRQKTGLVGRNGVGKSTLIKLMTGELRPHSGSIQVSGKLAYVPQGYAGPLEASVADLLGVQDKLEALHRIMAGSVNEHDFSVLDDDWEIKARIQQQLSAFGLTGIPYDRRLHALSGGEITRLLLARAFLSGADFLILDEPTNHLDLGARLQLYDAIKQWQGGLIVISHDRALLNLMEQIVEITSLGVLSYGGNYDDYTEQKDIEKAASEQELNDAKKLLQKTKNTIQSSHEKHEKKQSQGRELRRSGSIDKLTANSKRGKSERSQHKLLIKEERLIRQADTQMEKAREKIEVSEEIQVELPATRVPSGKVVLAIEHLAFSYDQDTQPLIHNFNLTMQGPERIAMVGDNGSGKTTLVKLILQQLQPLAGQIHIGVNHVSYLDQNASLLNADHSILQNFLLLNPDANENDAYRYLAQFLFRNVTTGKLVKQLSGGEKLRALLACVLMAKQPPQLLILDEPTNHLDLHSIASIESALKNYQGAMLVISHDQEFLKNIGINKTIHLRAK